MILILKAENGASTVALVVFAAAAFTDFLDGVIARRTDSITDLGRKIDPLADRLLISCTIIALAIAGVLPAIGVILVAARDLFMIIGYKLLQRRGVAVRVSFLGKTYTALFMVAIVVAMLGFEPGGFRLGWWLFWLGVAGSLITGIGYALSGLSQLESARKAQTVNK